jgi:signal transduction histidine kinase
VSDVWADADRSTRGRLALDVTAALLVGALMVPLYGSVGSGAVVAGVLVGAAVGVRRRSWQLMSGLAFAAAVVQVASSQIAYLADLAYAALFFSLGAHHRSSVRRFGIACVVVAAVVAGAYGALQPRAEGSGLGALTASIGLGALTALVSGGGWVSGFVRWQRRQAVQARVDAQLEAVERRRMVELYSIEQERRRIAADMHDVVAHSWAVVAAQSDGARYALRTDPVAAGRALEVIGDTARTAITDLRTIVAQLHDPSLAPPTPGHHQQVEVVDRMRASGMNLVLHETGARDDSPLLALTAHRLLSEALMNVLKHGDLGAPVTVEQDWQDGYRLCVTNDLAKAHEDAPPNGTGHGLVGMAERATVAGGTFRAGAEDGKWVVRVLLPTGGRDA